MISTEIHHPPMTNTQFVTKVNALIDDHPVIKKLNTYLDNELSKKQRKKEQKEKVVNVMAKIGIPARIGYLLIATLNLAWTVITQFL